MEYLSIIDAIKSSGKYSSFQEALGKSEFVIMRHDVEFSVERAFNLALFEHDNDFRSIYFFQLTNNSYNLLSGKNIACVKEILRMGHQVGLHFHLNGLTDMEEIRDEIRLELNILSAKLPEISMIFSFHRPTKEVLRANMKFKDIMNAYQDDFFSFVEDLNVQTPAIKYLSDAQHRWNYGLYPDVATILQNDRIQILTHPYSWMEEGHNNLDNFRTLLMEKNREMIATIDSECKHFAEVKDAL